MLGLTIDIATCSCISGEHDGQVYDALKNQNLAVVKVINPRCVPDLNIGILSKLMDLRVCNTPHYDQHSCHWFMRLEVICICNTSHYALGTVQATVELKLPGP